MLVKGDPKTIDVVFIVAILVSSIVVFAVDLPIKDTTSMPSILEGLTTVTGLLFAVDALLLTRFYTEKSMPIERIRAGFYTIVLAIASFFIGLAYVDLLLGSLILSFKIALEVFNISYVTAIILVAHLMRKDLLRLIKNQFSDSQKLEYG